MKTNIFYLLSIALQFCIIAQAHAFQLQPSDEAEAFKVGGYLLTDGKWRSECNEPLALSFTPAKIESVTDLNGDGLPDVVITEGGIACYGNTGSGFTIVSKQSNKTWKPMLSSTGIPSFLKTKGVNNWPDIEIGGPGFCFSIWRWNGKSYEINRYEYKGKSCKSDLSSVASASEVNYAWWVTYRYEPTSNEFKEIKASDLNEDFESLSVFSCDPPATFSVEECEEIERNGLTLQATGDFNSDGVKEIWHLGVAKTKKGQYYKFLMAMSENGDLLHFLNIEYNKPGFSVFSVREHSLSWAMCMECGDLADLVWSDGAFKLDWLGDY